MSKRVVRLFPVLLLACFSASHLFAQAIVPFEQTEAYGRYKAMSGRRGELDGSIPRVDELRWSADGKQVAFKTGDQHWLADLVSGSVSTAEAAPDGWAESVREPNQRAARPGAGRAKQRESELSPDGKLNAVYRDFNVWIEPAEGESGEKMQVTQDGHERLRYGTCCWVYGEELYQDDAMWWSGDSRWLVFYEVDEAGLKDYWLTYDNTAPYTRTEAVRYPKAGDDNPQVNLMAFDRETGETRRLGIPGEPRQYLYKIRFAPDGKTLLVNRTNRRQDILDVLAIDLASGQSRIVVSETQSTWQDNAPLMRFLADGQRFIWETEANGWKHFQLRHLDGRLINNLTGPQEWPCESIELLDEAGGWVYFTANSDANPYNAQLHRVRLDGSDARRISSSPLNHTRFSVSPDHQFAMAVREAVDTPPQTVVYECATGRETAVLATGTRDAANAAGLAAPELFSFLADDGKTTVWGYLHKPAHFDPAKKYPLLIDVYGGPSSRGMSNTWSPMNPKCELGLVVAKVGNRGTTGRGKAFESATYLRLGEADIADQAAAVRHLVQRPWIDAARVGIYGHSYGGYMSALGVLKFPEVFQVGIAGAPVTDWRNYDTIYTERYMRTPQENSEGYLAGSCMPLADNLKGRLLLVHGLIDDNVHPANTWQLAEALQKLNKPFDMMIYPGFQHGIGSNYNLLVLEYLYEHLVGE